MYTPLQLREIFHIEFLRCFASDLNSGVWSLKGGVNLRLFYKSIRYSEDMDIDIITLSVESLKKRVIRLLNSNTLLNNLKTYGIKEIITPDMEKTKQTSTTQRFKIHIITVSGEDYFTKIEFSRRGFAGKPVAQSVPPIILRPYKISPFIVWHYPAVDAALQKISALISRSVLQARDIFDLYFLSSQVDLKDVPGISLSKNDLSKASEFIMRADFKIYKDMVINYISEEDSCVYDSKDIWDEIKLKVVSFIEELGDLNVG
jgi:hypothetical protein